MRIRPVWLSAAAALAIVAAACTAGATPTPPPATGPTVAPTTEPTTAPTEVPWKVGVVTDVGTVNDKNFNEYSFLGAKDGAAAVGAAEPPVFVPKDASEYATGIKSFVDQGFNVIVTVGFNLTNDTATAAKANPNIWFIGVDQGACVDENGDVDTTFSCKGDAATLLPHLIGISYQEDQAGYLAGMAAAAVSKSGVIGAIGGISLCGPCIRYIQGYELGAKAVNPNIVVKSTYVTDSDFVKAFNDPVTGKSFGKQFIQQNKVDVLFQVAGKTGNGVLDAACEAGILAIGVDVDQHLSYPNASACIVTSAEKHLASSVKQTIQAIAAGTAKGGDNHFGAVNDGIGASPFYDMDSLVSADVKAKMTDALAAMKAGTLKTCPDTCGKL